MRSPPQFRTHLAREVLGPRYPAEGAAEGASSAGARYGIPRLDSDAALFSVRLYWMLRLTRSGANQASCR